MKKSPEKVQLCLLKLAQERDFHCSIKEGFIGTPGSIATKWKGLYRSIEHLMIEEFGQQSPYWKKENFIYSLYHWINWDQDKPPSARSWLLKSPIAKKIHEDEQKFFLHGSEIGSEPIKNDKTQKLRIPILRQKTFFLEEVIKGNGYIFSQASPQLKKDEEFILTLVSHDKSMLAYVPESKLQDPSFAIRIMKIQGLALKYFNLELSEHKEIIWEAVRQNGLALAYAPEKFKNNTDFVMQAVKNNGLALFFASNDLKNKKEIVLAALASGGVLEHVGSELRENTEIVLRAEKKTPDIRLFFFSKALDKNKDTFFYFEEKLKMSEESVYNCTLDKNIFKK